jgi:peptide/nickel transport system substrate-binding protein
VRRIFKSFLVLGLCIALIIVSLPFAFSQQKNPLGQYPTIKDYERATGRKITKFNEAPMLVELVKQGKLPPVEKRLPEEPAVVEPVEEVGQYGGTWRRAALSKANITSPRMGYEPLVRWARDGKTIIPNVCTSWKVTEGGRVYTFFLRKGLKWSDGEPFTADDIMFWYEDVICNKDLTPIFPSWLVVGGKSVEVKKINDYTIQFKFSRPYSLFLNYLAGPGGPSICSYPKHYLKQFHIKYVSEEKLKELVKDFKFSYWYQLFLDRADCYSNPELPSIKAWIPKAKPGAPVVNAERNPYYWKIDISGNQLPYIDRMSFIMVQEPQMITMKAVQGELDMQGGGADCPFSDFTLLVENSEKGNYKVFQWNDGKTGSAVFFNQNYTKDKYIGGLLRNIKFRKALSLAINRDEINQLIYLGQAPPTYMMFPFTSLQNDPEIRSLYEYNITEANKLLDELGLSKRDKDGFRLRPDGKTLQLTIIANLAFPIHPDVMQLIAQYWNKVGIKTVVDAISGSLWFPRIQSSDYQIAGYTAEFNKDCFDLTYSTISIVPSSNTTYWCPLWGLWYATGGKSGEKPTGDALKLVSIFDKIKLTVNTKEREKLTEEMLRIWAGNLWVVPVAGSYNLPVIVKNNFRNVPKDATLAYPLSSPGYLNPEQFFIKEAK